MKTRIKDIDGLYYPEYRSWGFWFGIGVDTNKHGNSIYYTNNLNIVKTAIDKYLSKSKSPTIIIIEYPTIEE